MRALKAGQVLDHFCSVGTWVNWDNTVDQFLHGDREAEVTGIACAWIPTNRAIREAGAKGLNLFITHEPAFYRAYEEPPSGKELAGRKRALLDELGITVLRCHDTWDRMPEFGIPDAWAEWLGFPTAAGTSASATAERPSSPSRNSPSSRGIDDKHCLHSCAFVFFRG